MWLAALSKPDHNTLNRFRSQRLKTLKLNYRYSLKPLLLMQVMVVKRIIKILSRETLMLL